MGILSAFTTGIRAAAGGGDSGPSFSPFDDRWYGGNWFGHHSAAGMRVTPESAKRLATVFACVAKKSTAIAMLPCKIYTQDADGATKIVGNHPLYDLLYAQPNPLQTAFEFKQMMQSHVELRGNAYAEIIPGPRGAVDQLMPLHPDRVVVEQLMGSGRLRYRYSDPLTGSTRVLMQDEVFHLRELPDVVGVGQSRITAACDVLGLALLQQDYNSRFLANDATPGALITGTNFRTDEDEEEFVASLKKSRTKENRGRPFLLPPGVDMKTLAVTPVDQQLLDSMKASDQRICSIFNVLPHTIGVDAGKAATFASTEQFNLMHVQQCVLPMAIMWEQAIQRCLITSPRFYAKFSLASLMRGDAATRGKYYQLLISSGVINPDEVRELEDMNPIPGGAGKAFWNPLNWGKLDRKETAALPSQTVGLDDDDDDDADEDDPTQESDLGDGEDDQQQAASDAQRVKAAREQRKLDAVVDATIKTLVEHQRKRAA
jgi:HK97 family phage portal protein